MTTPHSQTQPTPQPFVDRRTVLRAGAWSVPAIAVAAALPAAAASPNSLEFTASALVAVPGVDNAYDLVVTYDYGGVEDTVWALNVVMTEIEAATFSGATTFTAKANSSSRTAVMGTVTVQPESTGSDVIRAIASRGRTTTSPAATIPRYEATTVDPTEIVEGNVPVEDLIVTAYPLSDLNQNGLNHGPLYWAGGQVQYQAAWDSKEKAEFGYLIELVETTSSGSQKVLADRSGIAELQLYGSGEAQNLPGIDLTWGDAGPELEPLVTGSRYRVRMTVRGLDGIRVATSNEVTITG